MLLLVLVGAACAVMVVNGIVGEVPEISRDLDKATDDLSQFLTDQESTRNRSRRPRRVPKKEQLPASGPPAFRGRFPGIAGISSAFFFLAMVLLSSFFAAEGRSDDQGLGGAGDEACRLRWHGSFRAG